MEYVTCLECAHVIRDGLALTVQTALSEAPVSMDGVSTDHLNANVTVDTRE